MKAAILAGVVSALVWLVVFVRHNMKQFKDDQWPWS